MGIWGWPGPERSLTLSLTSGKSLRRGRVLRLKGLSLMRNQGILKLETMLQFLYIKKKKNQCQIHIFIIMFALKEAFKKLNFHILGVW